MSNPGVITHEAFALSSNMPVKIEDNLGESVHIHIGPLRLDMTLNDLSLLSHDAESLLNTFLGPFGLAVSNFDREFIGQISHMLIDLESAVFEEVDVADLLVTIKRGKLGRLKVTSIAGSDVIRAMNLDYKSYNRTFGLDKSATQQRVLQAQNIISSGKYGATGERIVLFNDQMFIRDGQHRAAAIFAENPNAKIEVLRLKFRDGRYSVPKLLLLASLKEFSPTNLRRYAGKAFRFISHLSRRTKSKINRVRNYIRNGTVF